MKTDLIQIIYSSLAWLVYIEYAMKLKGLIESDLDVFEHFKWIKAGPLINVH